MRSTVSLNRKRQGLTLIELVLVVAVLAILAGFIVPRLGFIRNLAGDAGNSTTVADAVTQSVLYNTAIGHYPDGEDSLLTSAGAFPVAGTVAGSAGINSSLISLLTPTAFGSAPVDDYATVSLAAQITGSATGGTFHLYDFAGLVANPNLDATVQDTISVKATTVNGIVTAIATPSSATGGSGKIAVVTVPTSSGTAGGAAYSVYSAAYGPEGLGTNGAPTDNTFLVAIGYGSASQINGKTGLEAPTLFSKVPNTYTRPILLLKVYPSATTGLVPAGTAAVTSTGLSYDGTTVTTNLAKYQTDQNR